MNRQMRRTSNEPVTQKDFVKLTFEAGRKRGFQDGSIDAQIKIVNVLQDTFDSLTEIKGVGQKTKDMIVNHIMRKLSQEANIRKYIKKNKTK